MKEYRNLLEAPVMRTIRLPEPLWHVAKAHGERTGQPVRVVLEQAVQSIPRITQSLRDIGVRNEYRDTKAVRAPLATKVLEAMRTGHEQTGLPQIQMLVLALHHLTTTAAIKEQPARRRRRRNGRRLRSKSLK